MCATMISASHFNPRPPWGGRLRRAEELRRLAEISIHALRGEGDLALRLGAVQRKISIHALRGEGDKVSLVTFKYILTFQSTPSVGRATKPPNINQYCEGISIHALRGEGDILTPLSLPRALYFNPRPPWGGRLEEWATTSKTTQFQSTPSVGRATRLRSILRPAKLFQSTPSVGRATHLYQWDTGRQVISIHALRGEGDPAQPLNNAQCRYFNPRPPWGGRQKEMGITGTTAKISIHALRGEGDYIGLQMINAENIISIHALRGEGDNSISWTGTVTKVISIHALRGEGDPAKRWYHFVSL